MLNKIEIMGRFVADPVLTYVNGATPVTNFIMAVQRDRKNSDGTRDTDFIDCTAWRGVGEHIAAHCHKGELAVVCGRLVTKKWLELDSGEKRYRAEIQVQSIY
ncbi:MAG: single-stranded DNA-binding protein, partial [Eubacteriales bacterium]